MTDKERIDDAYERIDIDTDEILAFYDGERVERCVESIWDSTVTMHQIATVALKENVKLRKLVQEFWCLLYDWLFKAHEVPYDELKAVGDHMRELGMEYTAESSTKEEA